MSIFPFLAAAAVWWVTGPDHEVREVRQLLRDGNYSRLEALVAAEDRWVLVLLQESDLKPAPLTWPDWLKGVRRFRTIDFSESDPRADLSIQFGRIRAVRLPQKPPEQIGQHFRSLQPNPLFERARRPGGWLKATIKATPDDEALISKLFLVVINRQPTEEELQAAADHFAKEQNRELAGEDVAWALLNSNEFRRPKGK